MMVKQAFPSLRLSVQFVRSSKFMFYVRFIFSVCVPCGVSTPKILASLVTSMVSGNAS